MNNRRPPLRKMTAEGRFARPTALLRDAWFRPPPLAGRAPAFAMAGGRGRPRTIGRRSKPPIALDPAGRVTTAHPAGIALIARIGSRSESRLIREGADGGFHASARGEAARARAGAYGHRGALRAGGDRRRRDGFRRVAVPPDDQLRPQSVFPADDFAELRFQPVHPGQPLGRLGGSGSGRRIADRHFRRRQFRPGGQGARRARGDGRDLLQGRHYPPGRRGGQIPRLRRGDRHRRGGRPRRPDHPDRLGAGLDLRPDHPPVARPAHHTGRRRRRRRHRRHVQHADRRRAVRDRTDVAGSQRQHLPAGRDRDRHRHFRRPAVLRTQSRFHGAAAGAAAQRSGRRRLHAAALHPARRADRGRRRGVHPQPAPDGGCFRQNPRPLRQAYARHAVGRRADLRFVQDVWALLRRRGRLRDDPGHSRRPTRRRRAAGAAVPVQDGGHLDQPRRGIIRGRIFAVSLYGRHPGRGLCRGSRQSAAYSGQRARLRDGRDGRDGGRGHRRGDDRRHHDLRDDAQLRHRAADDPRGRRQPRHPSPVLAREHLHPQTDSTRPSGAPRPARQYVPGAERQGRDGD